MTIELQEHSSIIHILVMRAMGVMGYAEMDGQREDSVKSANNDCRGVRFQGSEQNYGYYQYKKERQWSRTINEKNCKVNKKMPATIASIYK